MEKKMEDEEKKKKRRRRKRRHTDAEKMAMNMYLSIITFNVNGLNARIKRHRVAEWIREHDLRICYLQDSPQKKRSVQVESEGMGKNIPSKWT